MEALIRSVKNQRQYAWTVSQSMFPNSPKVFDEGKKIHTYPEKKRKRKDGKKGNQIRIQTKPVVCMNIMLALIFLIMPSPTNTAP